MLNVRLDYETQAKAGPSVLEQCVNIERQFRRALTSCGTDSNCRQQIFTKPSDGYVIVKVVSTIKIETA